MRTDPKGGYVNYSDYLDLKSQPDALTAYLYAAELGKEDRKILKNEVIRLNAENESLRKTGDAMATTLKDGGVIVSGYILADEWFKAKCLAAKEGKPTEQNNIQDV